MMLIEIVVLFVLVLYVAESYLLLKRKSVPLRDLLSNLNYGLFNRVGYASYGVLLMALYQFCFERFGFDSLKLLIEKYPAISYGIAFLYWDLCFYWAHRLSHTTSIGRKIHRCHHEGAEFNGSLAFRNGIFQQLFNFPFLLTMAFLGVDTATFLEITLLNLLYQYFIHSEYMPKLPFIRGVLNDAPHHRLHHAYNRVYLDRNYGGFLILWDRVFGTFIEEKPGETPKIGLGPKKYLDVIQSNFGTKNFVEKLGFIERVPATYALVIGLLVSVSIVSRYDNFLNLRIPVEAIPTRFAAVAVGLFLVAVASRLLQRMDPR